MARALIVRPSGSAADLLRLDTLTLSEHRTDPSHPPTGSRANPGGMDVTKVLGDDTLPFRSREPAWFKVPRPGGPSYRELVEDDRRRRPAHGLPGGRLPEHRRLLGARHGHVHDPRRHLHRRCGFCNVKTGKPTWNDPLEPLRVARSVARMGLRHAVITSVDRDDLPDYGASVWCGVIRSIRMQAPECKIECLTPDFRGEEMPLAKVIAERPDVFNHNVEVVAAAVPGRAPRLALAAFAARAQQRAGDGRGRGRDQVRPDGRPRRDPRRDGRGVRRPARGRRPDPHRRPVPAPDRAPPAGRPLLGARRSSRARGTRPTSWASSTSRPARSCAPATTPTSTSSRTARRRPARRYRVAGVRRTTGYLDAHAALRDPATPTP